MYGTTISKTSLTKNPGIDSLQLWLSLFVTTIALFEVWSSPIGMAKCIEFNAIINSFYWKGRQDTWTRTGCLLVGHVACSIRTGVTAQLKGVIYLDWPSQDVCECNTIQFAVFYKTRNYKNRCLSNSCKSVDIFYVQMEIFTHGISFLQRIVQVLWNTVILEYFAVQKLKF